jgi:MoaA/NifB/PqqE/SkfB family radical SAM enzyme
MKPAINLYLATSTACDVRCKTCPVGRREKEPGGTMSMDMLRRILHKCSKEARIIGVQLYHYNEPFLVPHMAEMVHECHAWGYPVFLSSNLVGYERHGKEILAEIPEVLLISVSGWTQPIYERSHKDGDIEKVKKNMLQVRQDQFGGTHVQVSWHKYRYNAHEEPAMRAYALKLGFAWVPYGTGLIPHDRAMRVWETGIDDPNGEDVLVPVKEAGKMCYSRRHWRCLLQDQIVAINGQGMLLNCSNLADEANLRGSLFETTIPQFLARRQQDSFCAKCKAVGGHVYALQAYSRSQWSPVRLAEVAYRRLKLAGRFPAITAWGTKLYLRPQEKETI